MGIYIWCEVVCSECCSTLPGEFATGAIPRRRITKATRDAGWRIVGKQCFCSDKCRDRSVRRASPTNEPREG